MLYGTRYQEAVKIFNSLLSLESLADPIKEVRDILQKCSDIQDLQSEVNANLCNSLLSGQTLPSLPYDHTGGGEGRWLRGEAERGKGRGREVWLRGGKGGGGRCG